MVLTGVRCPILCLILFHAVAEEIFQDANITPNFEEQWFSCDLLPRSHSIQRSEIWRIISPGAQLCLAISSHSAIQTSHQVGANSATHSISTSAPIGKLATPTHVRAGIFPASKNWDGVACLSDYFCIGIDNMKIAITSAYTSFIGWKSRGMLVRYTLTLTMCSSPEPAALSTIERFWSAARCCQYTSSAEVRVRSEMVSYGLRLNTAFYQFKIFVASNVPWRIYHTLRNNRLCYIGREELRRAVINQALAIYIRRCFTLKEITNKR